MNLGRWLRGATRIRFDDRTLSNLGRNAAVAGGTVLGGGAGLALAGLGSAAARGLAPGANIGDMARAGLSGAATAGALNAGTGLLKNAVSRIGSSGAGAGAATVPGPSASLDALTAGREIPAMSTIGSAPPPLPSMPPIPGAAPSVASAVTEPAQRGFLSRAVSAVGKNPMAASMGLQAAGSLASAGSENRLNDARADALELETENTQFSRDARRRRDAALAPIWSSLGTQTGGYGSVAPNPYLPQGG